MSEREWTGSVAVLPESMDALAVEMANLASSADAEQDDLELAKLRVRMNNFLRDHAYTLSEWAAAVRELYARLDEGEGVTNAQGVAMARLLRDGTSIRVQRTGIWVPTGHLGFELAHVKRVAAQSTFTIGSIEPDGSVNT